MADSLLFEVQTNGIKHSHADPVPDIDTRSAMVKDAGVFDYVDKTPEAVRHLLGHHAADREGHLGQISTEFIPGPDYGMGCRYSLFEQTIACAQWMRGAWAQAQAGPHAKAQCAIP